MSIRNEIMEFYAGGKEIGRLEKGIGPLELARTLLDAQGRADRLTILLDDVDQTEAMRGHLQAKLKASVEGKKVAAKAAKVVDIRLGEGSDNPLAYGKWKGALSAAVRVAPPTGHCMLNVGGSEIKAVVLEALLPLATGGVVRKLG